jgi:DtxR family Mn-dependent transcriptional regulator
MVATAARGKKVNIPTQDTSARRLSPATENYLLCLYKMREDMEFPTVTQLTDYLRYLPATESLGTSVPSVAAMIRRMQKQGLVDLDADKRIQLTERGINVGADMARRHRLAEWLVVRLVGMDLHRAHMEAHRLEHGMSPEIQERLMERLGYPHKSPFGRPIPGMGQPNTGADSLTLDVASTTESYVVDRVPEDDIELLRFLVESSVVPDREIKVLEATPYVGVLRVETATDRVSMGYDVARKILVRPAEPDLS